MQENFGYDVGARPPVHPARLTDCGGTGGEMGGGISKAQIMPFSYRGIRSGINYFRGNQ